MFDYLNRVKVQGIFTNKDSNNMLSATSECHMQIFRKANLVLLWKNKTIVQFNNNFIKQISEPKHDIT